MDANEILQEIEKLPEREKAKLFSFLFQKLYYLSPSFDFWLNEEDAIYDDI